METENKELKDFCNPYNTRAPKLQNPAELKFLCLDYGITLDHGHTACHVVLQLLRKLSGHVCEILLLFFKVLLERAGAKETERNIILLFYLFMRSLVDCVCALAWD